LELSCNHTPDSNSTVTIDLLCAQVHHGAITIANTTTLLDIKRMQPLSMSWGSVAEYMQAEVCCCPTCAVSLQVITNLAAKTFNHCQLQLTCTAPDSHAAFDS
jgi:hypothetical protein